MARYTHEVLAATEYRQLSIIFPNEIVLHFINPIENVKQ